MITPQETLRATTDIVSAYAGANPVLVTELVTLVANVYHVIETMGNPVVTPEPEPEPVPVPVPAVSVRRSIQPDHLVCLEDGKKLKMLKRHLARHFNMTPDEYRAKWGLAEDYPMVAPDYAKHRSDLAKRIGLGRQRGAKRVAA